MKSDLEKRVELLEYQVQTDIPIMSAIADDIIQSSNKIVEILESILIDSKEEIKNEIELIKDRQKKLASIYNFKNIYK